MVRLTRSATSEEGGSSARRDTTGTHMKLLLDENVSPRLVGLLAARGIPARHVAYAGLVGSRDDVVFAAALAADEVVVTVNAEDFLDLAAGTDVHPGVIVLREGSLTAEEQWVRLQRALDVVEGREELINVVVDVRSARDVRVLPIPP